MTPSPSSGPLIQIRSSPPSAAGASPTLSAACMSPSGPWLRFTRSASRNMGARLIVANVSRLTRDPQFPLALSLPAACRRSGGPAVQMKGLGSWLARGRLDASRTEPRPPDATRETLSAVPSGTAPASAVPTEPTPRRSHRLRNAGVRRQPRRREDRAPETRANPRRAPPRRGAPN